MNKKSTPVEEPASGRGKTVIAIICIIGVLIAIIVGIFALVFSTGSQDLSCEQTQEYGEIYKITNAVKFHYFLGELKTANIVETTWSKNAISDEEFEKTKTNAAETYGDTDKYEKWSLTKVDDNNVRLDVELQKTKENIDKFKTYDEAKTYLESNSYICK